MIYAVDRQTKRHLVFQNTSELLSGCFYFVEADADGWVKWGGGECPMLHDQLCDVKLGVAQKISQAMPASRWYWPWMEQGLGWDIVAYRPISNHEPQASKAPEWYGKGFPTCGAKCEAYVLAETNKNCDWRSGSAGFKAQASNGGSGMTFTDDSGGVHFIEAVTHFRLIRTDREKWVEAAKEHFCDDDSTATMEFIYDAIKSGELPTPSKD